MKKHILILFLLAGFLLLISPSCRSTYGSKKQRQTEKLQEQRKRETMEQYEQAVKRHQSIQTKETRKRLKKNEKEAKRKATDRKQFFLFRWFSK